MLERCLDSIDAQRLDAPFETIVVDDASTDGTAAMLDGRERLRVIRNEESLGFAAASNHGAAAASGEILFLLNADTVPRESDTLQRLADALADRSVGLAGPRLENPDGSLQPSCGGEPTLLRSLAIAIGVHRVLPDAARARVHPAVWSHDRSRSTGWLTGAALAIRAEVFSSVRGFWPLLYGEDTDLALKVKRLGLDVRFVADARVMHLGGHSMSQLRSEPRRAALVARSELALLAAHRGRVHSAVIRLATGLGYAWRSFALRATGRHDAARAYASMARVYAGTSTGRSPQTAR